MEKPHTVLIIIEAKPGLEQELSRALSKVRELSRQEEGCLEYRIYQDAVNPCKFGLYELWKSKEIHQKQFEKPYILDFANQTADLLAANYQGVAGIEMNGDFS